MTKVKFQRASLLYFLIRRTKFPITTKTNCVDLMDRRIEHLIGPRDLGGDLSAPKRRCQ